MFFTLTLIRPSQTSISKTSTHILISPKKEVHRHKHTNMPPLQIYYFFPSKNKQMPPLVTGREMAGRTVLYGVYPAFPQSQQATYHKKTMEKM